MISDEKPSLSAARLAVLIMFFVNGIVVGSWLARIPQFQARFGLSEGALGFILLFGSAGTISALAVTSGLIARFGSRAVTVAGVVATCAALPLTGLMPHPVALAASFYLLGASVSLMDVAMNTQAAEVERRRGRPLMSSFHGAWSIGEFSGAGLGSVMIANAVTPLPHFALVTPIFLILALLAARFLVHAHHDVRAHHEVRERERVFQFPAPALWPIGLVALCTGLGEGAVGDWSGIYLRDIVGTPAEVAALGLAAFSGTMTLGRFAGDWLAGRFKPATVVRVGGLLAGLGLLAVVLFPLPLVALPGFAAVGIGVANGIPLAFSAAGNVPGVPSSQGIAGVATIGYAAFLVGPPIIGLIAEASSLRISLGLVALLMASVVVLGRALQPSARVGEAVVVQEG